MIQSSVCLIAPIHLVAGTRGLKKSAGLVPVSGWCSRREEKEEEVQEAQSQLDWSERGGFESTPRAVARKGLEVNKLDATAKNARRFCQESAFVSGRQSRFLVLSTDMNEYDLFSSPTSRLLVCYGHGAVGGLTPSLLHKAHQQTSGTTQTLQPR